VVGGCSSRREQHQAQRGNRDQEKGMANVGLESVRAHHDLQTRIAEQETAAIDHYEDDS
jgi:hypothetical protein